MLDVLQPGYKQVAAGYVVYGSSTMLVYTTGHGVNGFTYETSLGEYFLSHADLKMPSDGLIYSINEGASNSFASPVRDYIQYCKDKNFTARYIQIKDYFDIFKTQRPFLLVVLHFLVAFAFKRNLSESI